jgi:hypothetical protein
VVELPAYAQSPSPDIMQRDATRYRNPGELPDRAVMIMGIGQHYVTGRDDGSDIDLRKFARESMHLHGHLNAITDSGFEFGDDLSQNPDRADAASDRLEGVIDAYIARQGLSGSSEDPHKNDGNPSHRPSSFPSARQRSEA